MAIKKNDKDKKTTYIENNGYKYGCYIFNFGLLIDIVYRSTRLSESPWDLYILLFLGGLVTTAYPYKEKILARIRKK